MPSGCTPTDAFICPADYGGEALGCEISQDIIDHLRGEVSMTREEAFRWVEDEFAIAASEAYSELGLPKLTLEDGWDIFRCLALRLADMYNENT